MKNINKSATGNTSGPDKQQQPFFYKRITNKGNLIVNLNWEIFLFNKEKKLMKDKQAMKIGFVHKKAWKETDGLYPNIKLTSAEIKEFGAILETHFPKKENSLTQVSAKSVLRKMNEGKEPLRFSRKDLEKLDTERFMKLIGVSNSTIEDRRNGDNLRFVRSTDKTLTAERVGLYPVQDLARK